MPLKRKRRGKGPTDVPTSKKSKQGESLIIVSLFGDWNTLHIDKSAASPSKSPPLQPSPSELPVTSRQGACIRCRGRKVKCVYQGGSAECQGCILAGVECLHVAGVLGPSARPSVSRSKSRRSQSVISDHSRHSKSPESDHQKANTGNKCRASSQPKHAIGSHAHLLRWPTQQYTQLIIIDYPSAAQEHSPLTLDQHQLPPIAEEDSIADDAEPVLTFKRFISSDNDEDESESKSESDEDTKTDDSETGKHNVRCVVHRKKPLQSIVPPRRKPGLKPLRHKHDIVADDSSDDDYDPCTCGISPLSLRCYFE